MQVIEVTRTGGPEVLVPAERPDPVAGPGQVVVRVRAANINPTDLAARAGWLHPSMTRKPEPPYVLGWDFAGEVASTGQGVTGLDVGDRVVGMIHWYGQGGSVGAYAEAVAVDSDWLVRLPDGVDYAAACTAPLPALTAKQGLEILAPPPGAPVLVTGASGAVGGFAVQMAVAAGHPVIATAARDDEAWVRRLGATEVLPRDVDLRTIEQVPAVFDAVPLGEAVFDAVLDGGAVVNIRHRPETDPGRNIRVEDFLVRHDRAGLQTVVEEIAAGRFLTRVDRVLPLAEAAEAHRLVEAGGLRGKVVLAP